LISVRIITKYAMFTAYKLIRWVWDGDRSHLYIVTMAYFVPEHVELIIEDHG